MTRVAVIGGGVAGLTIAYQLLEKDLEVVLFEKNSGIALECSRQNGGQFSVSNSQTLHTWSNVKKGLSWMFKKDAPLHISPSLDPDKIVWISKFLGETIRGTHFKNSLKTMKMAMDSRYWWNEFFAKHGVMGRVGQDQYKYPGMLCLYSSIEELEKADALEKLVASYNSLYADTFQPTRLKYEKMNRAKIKSSGNMQHFSKVSGGLLFKEDKVANIYLLCHELKKACEETGRFKLYTSEKVVEIFKTSSGMNKLQLEDVLFHEDFDHVVVASGWDAEKLTKKFGTNMGIYPVKGYSIDIQCKESDLPPLYSINHDSTKIVSSTFLNEDGSRTLRVAGTMELSGSNTSVNHTRIKPLLDWTKENFFVDVEGFHPWACLRPMTPDMMPVVGHTPNDKTIWTHCGHGHLGLTLAMGTARELAGKIESAY